MKSKKHVRMVVRYSLPDGTQEIGWVRAAPDIAPETLEALKCLMELAAAQVLAEKEKSEREKVAR